MGIQHKVIWLDENNGRKWPLTFELSLEYLEFIENANYEIVDDQIYFVTENEMNIYNDYLGIFDRLVASEDKIVSEEKDRIEQIRRMAK